MNKKAVIVVGPAVEDTEFAYPFYRLQEEGFVVDVASNGKVDIVAKHGLPVKVNADIQALDEKDYSLLVIPGGLESPDRLRQIPELLDFIKKMNLKNKVIASICHGPWVLISADIVKGRNMTCYAGCKHDLINAGALYHDIAVISDRNIITSPHFRDNAAWMKETISIYNQLNY